MLTIAELEENFHWFFINKGGRLPNDQAPEGSVLWHLKEIGSAVCEDVVSNQYRDQQRQLYFDFFASNTPAAEAATRDGVDYIGLSRGLIVVLAAHFNALLAHSDVLPDIPFSPGGEPGQDPATSLPKDLKRREYAAHLLQIAVIFLVGHELGHHLNGHVRFLFGDNGSYAEHGKIAGVDWLDRHSLEMDADCSGVLQAMTRAAIIRDNCATGQIEDSEAFLVAYGTPEAALKTVIRAIHWTFLMFDRAYELDALRPDPASNHPPSRMRASWCGAAALEIAKTRPEFDLPQGRYLPLIPDTIFDAEMGWALACGLQRPNADILLQAHALGGAHLKEVKARWRNLYPKLQGLQLGNHQLARPDPDAMLDGMGSSIGP